MRALFNSKEHEKRMYTMIATDNTHNEDVERISLFYIISGNEDLYLKRHAIYNFKTHSIKLCIKNKTVDFSTGMYALIRLGFNLFNGYKDKYTTPIEIFCSLDVRNKLLAENAIRIRFGKNIFVN